MPRFCPHCGRPKTKEHHDRSPKPDHFAIDGKPRRSWICRLRRLADQTAPILRDARDGAPIQSAERKVLRTFVPDASVKQRTRENNLRLVPIELIKLRSRSG